VIAAALDIAECPTSDAIQAVASGGRLRRPPHDPFLTSPIRRHLFDSVYSGEAEELCCSAAEIPGWHRGKRS
jgi:hypothetical protein